jgi:hypothetical protein
MDRNRRQADIGSRYEEGIARRDNLRSEDEE